MQAFAVLGVLVVAFLLWLFVPRATMVVLVGMVLHHFYPWFGYQNGSNLEIVAVLASVAGIVVGLLIDIRICWYNWIK